MPTTIIAKDAFLRRLTFPKLSAALSRLPADGTIAAFQLWLIAVASVDLSASEAQQGVGYLQAIGILSASEAAAILAPVSDPTQVGAGSWYVAYDAATHELNREGPDLIEPAPGLTVQIYATAPVIWDAFSGRRLRQWAPSALDYVAVT